MYLASSVLARDVLICHAAPMTNDDHLGVTRQRTAREEIDLAIHLLFTGGSLVCANLLAWAAIDVLKGVARSQGIVTFGESIITDIVREDRVREWYSLIKEHYNFSKHADKDPDKVVDLRPGAVQFAVFEALSDYQTIYTKPTIPMLMFQCFFVLTNPDIYDDPDLNMLATSRAFFGEHPTLETAGQRYKEYFNDRGAALADLPAEALSLVET